MQNENFDYADFDNMDRKALIKAMRERNYTEESIEWLTSRKSDEGLRISLRNDLCHDIITRVAKGF